MFVSSLLWLLVSQYVSNLIRISKLFHDYYRWYYQAYAGLELGLSQTLQHGYGFEDSNTYTDFSACPAWGLCSFDMEIDSRSHVLYDSPAEYSNCNEAELWWAYYTVAGWNGFIVPLFWDASTGFENINYLNVDDVDLVDTNPQLYNNWQPWDIYTVKVIDEELENYNSDISSVIDSPDPYEFASDLSGYVSGPWNKNYLVVVNTTGSSMEFCIELDSNEFPLPGKYIIISSVWYYGNAIVSLGATKVNQLPSYLIYSTIE